MRGDDIDTDRIMPARFLRAVTFEGLEQHLFEDERAGSAAGDRAASPHPFDDARYRGASILLVNRNFGCGSSREHAPQGLHRWGIRAVVGESFSEIFFGNSLMIGLPCVTASPADVRQLMDRVEKQPDARLRVDLQARHLRGRGLPLRRVDSGARPRRAGHRRVGYDRPAARALRRSGRRGGQASVHLRLLVVRIVRAVVAARHGSRPWNDAFDRLSGADDGQKHGDLRADQPGEMPIALLIEIPDRRAG